MLGSGLETESLSSFRDENYQSHAARRLVQIHQVDRPSSPAVAALLSQQRLSRTNSSINFEGSATASTLLNEESMTRPSTAQNTNGMTVYDARSVFPEWILSDREWQSMRRMNSDENEISEILQTEAPNRTAEQTSLLAHWLMSVWRLAAGMGARRCADMTRVFRHYVYEDGRAIITEGERGLSFFILVAGFAEVHKEGLGVVARLERGASFGEVALTKGRDLRTATIRAVDGPAEVLCLFKSDYDLFVRDIQQRERKENMSLLLAAPLFSQWPKARLDRLSSGCVRKTVENGSYIFQQGDRSDEICVVVEGEVDIVKEPRFQETNRWPTSVRGEYESRTVSYRRKIPLKRLRAGQLFGEVGVVTNSPRSSSAIAVGKCTVLCIDRVEFMTAINQEASAPHTTSFLESVDVMAERYLVEDEMAVSQHGIEASVYGDDSISVASLGSSAFGGVYSSGNRRRDDGRKRDDISLHHLLFDGIHDTPSPTHRYAEVKRIKDQGSPPSGQISVGVGAAARKSEMDLATEAVNNLHVRSRPITAMTDEQSKVAEVPSTRGIFRTMAERRAVATPPRVSSLAVRNDRFGLTRSSTCFSPTGSLALQKSTSLILQPSISSPITEVTSIEAAAATAAAAVTALRGSHSPLRSSTSGKTSILQPTKSFVLPNTAIGNEKEAVLHDALQEMLQIDTSTTNDRLLVSANQSIDCARLANHLSFRINGTSPSSPTIRKSNSESLMHSRSSKMGNDSVYSTDSMSSACSPTSPSGRLAVVLPLVPGTVLENEPSYYSYAYSTAPHGPAADYPSVDSSPLLKRLHQKELSRSRLLSSREGKRQRSSISTLGSDRHPGR